MIDLNTGVCICNSLSIKDVVKCIKNNNFATLDESLDNDICLIGDRYNSCRDGGFNNDGINIPMVLSMVENNQI